MSRPISIDRQDIIGRIEKGRRKKWWKRKRASTKGFAFLDAGGRQIADVEAVSRVTSLAIPPAWKYVRIAPSSTSKLQAIGVDGSGRIQYIYHPKFTERQQRKKFAKIERFGEILPQLRKITNAHISLDGFPREKVLAVMVRLINSLYIRVGTDESVRRYKTFGITTLQNRHLQVGRKGKLVFDFVGKSGVKHRNVLVDTELAAVLSELKELGTSKRLFHYHDENSKPRPIKPADINNYIKSITSEEYSSKDFRTWGASLLAAMELAEIGVADNVTQVKANVNKAIRKVAQYLGHTPSVCRGSYIHPTILKAYTEGVVLEQFRPRTMRRSKRIESDFEPEELALLKLFNTYRNDT